MNATEAAAWADHARHENAMGHRESAAYLVGRAAAYDGPAAKAVYAFAYQVHLELTEQAERIDGEKEVA